MDVAAQGDLANSHHSLSHLHGKPDGIRHEV